MDDRLESPVLLQHDRFDRELQNNTHPPQWKNPTPQPKYNLVVVGGGTAGLVSAGTAAILGAKVALVERWFTGGDCLVTGCVPSKSLLRAARAAADVQRAEQFGIRVPVSDANVDFAAVFERMRRIRAAISRHDAAADFRDEYGVDVFFGEARFTGPDCIETGGQSLYFRRAIIATGARPAVPAVPGLQEAGYLTNETIFNLTERPARLVVIGGGPLGCEMAQAFARLGSQVTLLEQSAQLLSHEDPETAALLMRVFAREGIRVRLNAKVDRVSAERNVKVLNVMIDGQDERVEADALLAGTGRAPNVDGLNLESAKVRYSKSGVKVDDFLRTSNRRIFAAGDICLKEKFTHTAEASARLAVQNALLLPTKRWSRQVVPRVTYTEPEIAHAGLSEKDASRRGMSLKTYSLSLEEVDRAMTDSQTEGFVTIHLKRGSDRIVGATIVASHAGDMLNQITIAMVAKIGLKGLSAIIFPYPTQSEAIKKLADRHFAADLTGWKRRLLQKWAAFRL